MESSFTVKASRSSVTRTVKVNVPAVVGRSGDGVLPLGQREAGRKCPGDHRPGIRLDTTAGEQVAASVELADRSAGERPGAVDQPVPVEPVPAGTVARPSENGSTRTVPAGADQQLDGRFFGVGAAR
jgi:hypothetical protein